MTPWVQLTRDDVVRIHNAVLPAPVRDEGLLASAVDKPWTSYMGVELYPSLADKAAALLVGLSRNHPFVDGNKRTAIGAVSAKVALSRSPVSIEERTGTAVLACAIRHML